MNVSDESRKDAFRNQLYITWQKASNPSLLCKDHQQELLVAGPVPPLRQDGLTTAFGVSILPNKRENLTVIGARSYEFIWCIQPKKMEDLAFNFFIEYQYVLEGCWAWETSGGEPAKHLCGSSKSRRLQGVPCRFPQVHWTTLWPESLVHKSLDDHRIMISTVVNTTTCFKA